MWIFIFFTLKDCDFDKKICEKEKMFKRRMRMKAYKLKITLADTHIPVWREVMIPSGITFERLHEILQGVMGWYDYHLYEYRFGNVVITSDEEALAESEYFKTPEGEEQLKKMKNNIFFMERKEILKRMTEEIDEYLENNKKFEYIYDFGDYWEHKVKILEIEEDYPYEYPKVLKAKGNCPPEDCGGTGGYEIFLNILTNKSHPEYEENKIWGEEQGYVDYDIEETNEYLKDNFSNDIE